MNKSLPLLLVLFAMCSLLLGSPAAAQAPSESEIVLYQAPMGTWVEDPFRPPSHFAGSGNRGLMYSTSAGHAVRAAADGRVSFAGQVGPREVITVQHDDGIRTTYTGLRSMTVRRGDRVVGGESMGVAINRFHFGARIGDHYLDPQILLDASKPIVQARLLPAGGANGQ